MEEQEERAPAEEVDDEERREAPERVNVVGPREPARPAERGPDAEPFEQCRRNGEADEGEPRDRGQDVEPDEDADRQEDDHADDEGPRHGAPRRALPRRERAGPDVGEREEGRSDREQDPLRLRALPDGELIEDRDDEPERERGPEPPAVEADRVGDELADGPVGRGGAFVVRER